MNYQEYYDKYGIEVQLKPRLGDASVLLTCTDVTEAWDCYTLLLTIDATRKPETRDLQSQRYSLGLVYLANMARVLRHYLEANRRRRHHRLSVSRLIRSVSDAALLPAATIWSSANLNALDQRRRRRFVQDYEAASRNIDGLLRLLHDIVKETYSLDGGETLVY